MVCNIFTVNCLDDAILYYFVVLLHGEQWVHVDDLTVESCLPDLYGFPEFGYKNPCYSRLDEMGGYGDKSMTICVPLYTGNDFYTGSFVYLVKVVTQCIKVYFNP